MTAKAINVCRRVGKPSQESKKVLNKLFPSTSSSYKFNPKKESCAEKNKLKKKAAIPKGGKARIITAVLMRDLPSKVPRGAFRRRLSSEGRIAKISIRRSMTSAQINDVISNSFSVGNAKNAKFVKCNQANSLSIVESQKLDGDQVANLAGNGSLYLVEVRYILRCRLWLIT